MITPCTPSQILINPEYARLLPKVPESQYEEIKHDIRTNGQYIPIIINQKGEILDGHTRFKACNELGITPLTMMREEFEDPLLAKQFIININRNRRHLNSSQRIELEYKYAGIESELDAHFEEEANEEELIDVIFTDPPYTVLHLQHHCIFW